MEKWCRGKSGKTGGSRDRYDCLALCTEIRHQMFKYHCTLSVSVQSIFTESHGFRKAGPGA